jgi:large subunit ribosomal protein L32
MACPKKKTSKAKRDQRRAHWRKQASLQAQRALSLGKSVLSGRSNSFIYPEDEEEDEE